MFSHEPARTKDPFRDAVTSEDGFPPGDLTLKPESAIRVSFSPNSLYRTVDLSARAAGCDVPYFYGAIEETCYVLTWAGRDDVDAFVEAVGRFKVEAAAMAGLPRRVQLTADRARSDGIRLVMHPQEYMQFSCWSEDRGTGKRCGSSASEGPSYISFEQAGETFWKTARDFLRVLGREDFLALTISLSWGDFQFQRVSAAERQHVPYEIAVSFMSHLECPDLLAALMCSTHLCPLRKDHCEAGLKEAVGDFTARHRRRFQVC